MSCLADNLKYLLWSISRQRHLSTDAYDAFLRSVADGCTIPYARFRQILDGTAEATDTEIRQIKGHLMKHDEERIPYIDCEMLFQGDIDIHKNDLILDNILYLIRTIPRGDNQEFADALQIRGSTLTRWKNGTMKPSRYFQREICKYFKIGEPEDLKAAYFFFGLSPVSTPQKKLECKRLIDELDRDEFEKLYPALLKLLN